MSQQQHPLANVPSEGLILIGSPSCGPCGAAAQVLDQKGIVYRKLQIDGDVELMNWLSSVTGQRTIPQFFYNGEWVRGGFKEVLELIETGTLRPGVGLVTQLASQGQAPSQPAGGTAAPPQQQLPPAQPQQPQPPQQPPGPGAQPGQSGNPWGSQGY